MRRCLEGCLIIGYLMRVLYQWHCGDSIKMWRRSIVYNSSYARPNSNPSAHLAEYSFDSLTVWGIVEYPNRQESDCMMRPVRILFLCQDYLRIFNITVLNHALLTKRGS